jgi:hypothetical protein
VSAIEAVAFDMNGQTEVLPTDGDVLWRFDMREELGVFPHNITSSSVLVQGDTVFATKKTGHPFSLPAGRTNEWVSVIGSAPLTGFESMHSHRPTMTSALPGAPSPVF